MKATIQYDSNTYERFSICSELNKSAFWPQSSLGSSSFWGIHWGVETEASNSTLGQTARCLTWPDSVQETKYKDPHHGHVLCWWCCSHNTDLTTTPVPLLQSMQRLCIHHQCDKNSVLGQNLEMQPCITNENYELGVVCQFTYLGSTVSDNLSLDVEMNKYIRKLYPHLVGSPLMSGRIQNLHWRPK